LSEFSGLVEEPVLWLSLAATQWKCGRLEERVKQRALAIIDNGSDLERWEEDPKLIPKRLAVLQKLRSQLLSPQPPPSKIPQRYRSTCEWETGEVIAYRLLSGKFVLLHLVGTSTDKGGTYPHVEILDWTGDELPPLSVIAKLEIRQPKTATMRSTINRVMLGETSPRKIPGNRMLRLNMKREPLIKDKRTGGLFVLWRFFDEVLREDYGLG
jgi:hypothetical protein